jgi:diguanylate cyclase
MDSFPVIAGSDAVYTVTQHLDTRGSICLLMGRYEEAIELYTSALALAEGKNSAMAYSEHLARAYEQSGDLASALASYKRFHLLYCQVASETAQRNARVAAVRLETEQAKARAEQERVRADGLLRISLEDPLTGLANRRHTDELLAAGVEAYTVALVDVDHFKRVNDTYSHQIGDEVLRELAGVLRACCRGGDVAARYGGEEFAVLFHDLPATEAAAAAERIRRTVEAHAWGGVTAGLAVTVSIGVAAAGEARHAGGMLSMADRRLYAAKNAGRNRVVTHE